MSTDPPAFASESTEASAVKEIHDYLTLLHPDESPVAICCKNGTTMTGEVFTNYEEAARYAAQQDATGEFVAIYVNLNRLKPEVRGVSPSKEDVAAYSNLLIDFDRREREDSNASDEELVRLREFKEKVSAELNKEFEKTPLEIFTGNGYGLIYRLPEIPVTEQNAVAELLKRLDSKFATPDVNACIDTSVGDPQRLTRLCGTWNRKFPECEGRPHRRAQLLGAPELRYTIERDRLGIPINPRDTGSERSEASRGVLLKDGVNFGSELGKKIKFEIDKQSDATYYYYHGIAGQPCLVAGHIHTQNVGNPRCSTFVETKDHRVYHTCFADGCRSQEMGKTRLAIKAIGLEKVLAVSDGSDWRERCHNFFQLTTEVPVHIVENLVPEKCVTIYSGPSFHGKTFFAQDTAFSIITGRPLLEHFKIAAPTPVFYHIPEMSESLFRYRLSEFHFGNLPDKEMFLCRTMEDGTAWALDSPEMKLSSKGRVIFLDTMMYFNAADDISSYAEVRRFAENCYKLIANGCRAIVALYHPTKFAAGQDEMTLQNYVLGSAGYGGILGSCVGFRCLNDETRHIYIQQLKARGTPLKPFQIEGIREDGHLRMKVPPGDSPYLRELLKSPQDEKYAKACEMFEANPRISQKDIAAALHVSPNKVSEWFKQWKSDRDFEKTQGDIPGTT